MWSEPTIVVAVIAASAAVGAPVSVAIITHLLNQRAEERRVAREDRQRHQARIAFWRSRATRAERQVRRIRASQQRMRTKARTRQHSR